MDTDTGLYYYGARYYDPRVSLWLNVDPLAEKTMTPYAYTNNNPINLIDPDGRESTSTHIDQDGKVITVFNDGDNGVYQHSKNADGGTVTEYQLSKRVQKYGTSSGGIKVGETEYWDEFVNPEDRSTMTDYIIQVGKSFNPIIENMHKKAKDIDLKEIASKSEGGQLFDIKVPYRNVGALLNGKYATSRSAGNFLAGYNAQGGTLFGSSISFETFQKLAGALHIEESNGKKLSFWQKVDIIIQGTYRSSDISKFKAPTWGEVNYQYRMSKAGWQFGEKKKNNHYIMKISKILLFIIIIFSNCNKESEIKNRKEKKIELSKGNNIYIC